MVTSDTLAEAGRKAGYYDRPTTHRALETIKLKMPEVLEKAGLTDEFVANNCLRPMMAATKKTHFANGGIVTETKEDPDHTSRHKALTTYYKLTGAPGYKKETDDGPKQSGGLTINFALFDPARAAELAALIQSDLGPAVLADELHQDGG